MNTLEQTYQFLRSRLEETGHSAYIEPYSHVEQVDALRQQYRPRDVRLLVVAESHVRRSDDAFLQRGPAFLYNPRYYTPWWTELLLPALGGTPGTNAEKRAAYLTRMQDCGIWMLDASVLSLSGYRTTQADWEPRPFTAVEQEIVKTSWAGYVQHEFASVWRQQRKPVLCVFERINHVLPTDVRTQAIPLRFLSPGANSRVCYRSPEYRFGTERFREAARQAGVANCLSGNSATEPVTSFR